MSFEKLEKYLSNFFVGIDALYRKAESWNQQNEGTDKEVTVEELQAAVFNRSVPSDDDLKRLTYEQLLTYRLKVQDAIKAHEDEATTVLTEETTVEGYLYKGFELKRGNSQRKFTDYPAIVNILVNQGACLEDLYTLSPLGIPAIEKMLKEKLGADLAATELEKYTTKPPGKLKLNYRGNV